MNKVLQILIPIAVVVALLSWFIIRPFYIDKYLISSSYSKIVMPSQLTILSSEWRGPLDIDAGPSAWHYLYVNGNLIPALIDIQAELRSQNFQIQNKNTTLHSFEAINKSMHLYLSVTELISERGNRSQVEVEAKRL